MLIQECVCYQCDTIFCHGSEFERHERTEHNGWGIGATIDDSEFDKLIYPRNAYKDYEGNIEEMDKHCNEISDSRSEGRIHVFINMQLTPNFA